MSDQSKQSLTKKVLIGMFLGSIVGLTINILDLNSGNSFVNTYIVDGLFFVIGKMFINALKMLVVPLVFFSLICGVCGIGNINTLGRVGSKSLALYILTTAIAITLGIALAASVGIGEGMGLTSSAQFSAKAAPPISDVLINIIPTNPIKAMANGDMLPLIFFSTLVGISLLMVGRKSKSFIEGAQVANEVMMKMVTIVMALAP